MVSSGTVNDVPALSLFSGLGGLDLGARVAGANVQLATDIDGDALDLLAATQGTETIAGRLETLLQDGTLESVARRPALVIGGPPCTGFSHAGFWLEGKRKGKDPAVLLLDAYVDAVRILKPDVFILENVPGLTFKNFRSQYDSLINRGRRAGYSISAEVLDASHFGVPQARRRLFVVGVRGGPQVDLDNLPKMPHRSTGWAIRDLADDDAASEPDEWPTGQHRKWLDEVPPGKNYLCLTKQRGHPVGPFEYRSRYWSFLLKIHPDEPSPTIPAQRVTYNGPFHWEGRHLRVRELARLQTFPDWQLLDDDLVAARKHIGNAVPPLLGAVVIRHVLVQLGMAPEDEPEALQVARSPSATFTDITRAFPKSEKSERRSNLETVSAL